jgi:hypothetical protein
MVHIKWLSGQNFLNTFVTQVTKHVASRGTEKHSVPPNTVHTPVTAYKPTLILWHRALQKMTTSQFGTQSLPYKELNNLLQESTIQANNHPCNNTSAVKQRLLHNREIITLPSCEFFWLSPWHSWGLSFVWDDVPCHWVTGTHVSRQCSGTVFKGYISSVTGQSTTEDGTTMLPSNIMHRLPRDALPHI